MGPSTVGHTEPGRTGVLIVDKPSGPTSFDIVAQVRKMYRQRAVGHAGTLDPLATGVLVVMLGEATKLCDYLTAANKTYVAELTFGRSTDTLDSEGSTIHERNVAPHEVSLDRVQAVLEAERQRSAQVPPAFSAIKQNGETAYKKARRGETVELNARPVVVHHLSLESLSSTRLRLVLEVSKGYYVRAMIRDICLALDVPGCLTALRRTSSGTFTLNDAVSWPPPAAAPALQSVELAAQRSMHHGVLHAEGLLRARHGKVLSDVHFEVVPQGSPAAWLGPDGTLVAIGERLPSDSALHRVLRGFRETVP